MRTKLVYTAPIAVLDSLDEPIRDENVLHALVGMSCPDETVLEYLDDVIPDREKFRGGFLRLVLTGKGLVAGIEIDSPRELTKKELKTLRDDLDGQVSDGIGEAGFDFVSDAAGVTIRTFPDLGRQKSTLTQTTGTAWMPKAETVENAANDRRCKAVSTAMNSVEVAAEKKAAKAKGSPPNPRKLFKLIQKGHGYPRPAGIEKEFTEEITKLGGDLSFIPSKQLPYERLNDLKLLRLLLDAKLTPNLHDCDGHSLLWLAVGNPKCIALLLDRGADVNLRNAMVYEDTALMDAARLGILKTVQLLLDRGADPAMKDRFGRTAIDEARNNTHSRNTPAIIRALEAAVKK